MKSDLKIASPFTEHFKETSKYLQIVSKHPEGTHATDAVVSSGVPTVLVGEHGPDGRVDAYKTFISGYLIYRGDDVNRAAWYWASSFFFFHCDTGPWELPDEEMSVQFGPFRKKVVLRRKSVAMTVMFLASNMIGIKNESTSELEEKEKKCLNLLSTRFRKNHSRYLDATLEAEL